MKNLRTGQEADTETGDESRHRIEAEKKKGPIFHRRALLREMDRLRMTKRQAQTQKDGTPIAYEAYREASRAKVFGATLAVVVAAFIAIVAFVTGHNSLLLWTGTIMVAIGSFLIGYGAVLAASAGDWLEMITSQQSVQETIYVHEASLLRQLKTVYEVLEYPDLLPNVMKNLDQEIGQKKFQRPLRYVISQGDLARLFLDSSGGAKLGTPLVVLGGIVAALAA